MIKKTQEFKNRLKRNNVSNQSRVNASASKKRLLIFCVMVVKLDTVVYKKNAFPSLFSIKFKK